MKSTLRGTILMCCAVVAFAQSAALATPKVFSKINFNKAQEDAKMSGKLLIADAMAVWCGPCKQMDKTTWVDPKVVDWIKQNAVAVQIDVDKQKDVSKKLRISAMPTVIAFRDGEEVARVVGYQSAAQLLSWLEGMKPNGGANDKTPDPPDPPGPARDQAKPAEKVDVDARYKLAEKLLQSGKYDEATQEYIWLWDNMLKHKPAMTGVRLSFMIDSMTELAKKHEPAQKAFTKLRNRYQLAMDAGSTDFKVVSDWLHLNKVIEDDDATLKWFDRVKNERKQEQVLDLLSYVLVEFLIEHDRWAGAGKIMRDPAKKAQEQLAMLEEMAGVPEGQADRKETMQRHVRDEVAKMYAACLAAEREEPAANVAKQLLKTLDNDQARLALVEWALKAGEPRKEHRALLEQVEANGEKRSELQQKLDKALANRKDGTSAR